MGDNGTGCLGCSGRVNLTERSVEEEQEGSIVMYVSMMLNTSCDCGLTSFVVAGCIPRVIRRMVLPNTERATLPFPSSPLYPI